MTINTAMAPIASDHSVNDSLSLQFCDIQGRLFQLSGKHGYPSVRFAETFMLGHTAAHFDLPFDRTQWMGEEYLLEEVEDEAKANGTPLIPTHDGDGRIVFPHEILYWMGYLYRYWHLLTGEPSKLIYRLADAATMRDAYAGFHTIGNELAVDDLRRLGFKRLR